MTTIDLVSDASDAFAFLTIELAVDFHVARLSVRGEIDQATVPQLRAALDRCLLAAEDIALDMDGVEFMDSSGLGALIGGYKRAAARGGSLRIERASRPVRDLLSITGQTERFLQAG